MLLTLARIYLPISLTIFSAPAFSHSGHTDLFHSHSGIEYLLVLCVIAAIIYHYIKS